MTGRRKQWCIWRQVFMLSRSDCSIGPRLQTVTQSLLFLAKWKLSLSPIAKNNRIREVKKLPKPTFFLALYYCGKVGRERKIVSLIVGLTNINTQKMWVVTCTLQKIGPRKVIAWVMRTILSRRQKTPVDFSSRFFLDYLECFQTYSVNFNLVLQLCKTKV